MSSGSCRPGAPDSIATPAAELQRVAGHASVIVAKTGDGPRRSVDLGTIWQREDERLPCDEAVGVEHDGRLVSVLLGGGRLWLRPL
jgi:hypothetical protein